MNINEAIEKIENESWEYWDSSKSVVETETVIDIISQIHEPQKVVIPKFVVEWIEYCKSNNLTLLGAFEPVSEHGIGLANTFTGEVRKSIDWAKRNQEIFARAWLDGYTIEQEKLYTIELPNGQGLCESESGALYFGNHITSRRLYAKKTKDEFVKAGYAWAWEQGFAKEVE